MNHTYATLSIACILCVTAVTAAEKAKNVEQSKAAMTWIDPAKAVAEDPDFSIQGEYGVDAPGQVWAVQVVALGDGKFDAYLLEDGLPGLGWTRDKQRINLSGVRQGDLAELATDDGNTTASIRDGEILVQHDGKLIATLPRIERKSQTLGAKPPAEAIILFDGTSADAWINGRVENDLLPNTNITTKQKFQDYTLHLEFRTPYKPFARGQQRGISGVYHQGRFETQVLDSFGLEGAMNETGGIYTIAQSRINMCLPPLTWQTYDVDFTAPRFDPAGQLVKNAQMTVRLNGVIVHENQELPHTTTAAPIKKVTPEPGPIFIQHHGNPVYYQNIWVVEK